MDCKLQKNILQTCGLSSIGIDNKVYIYDTDDVVNLVFEDDKRLDDDNFIQSIITEPKTNPLVVEGTGWTYEKSYNSDTGDYTYKLEGVIIGIDREKEEKLTVANRGRYLVAFHPTNADYWCLIGYRNGCTFTHSSTLSDGQNDYQVSFDVNSSYPLLFADPSNFNQDRPFVAQLVPDYRFYECEQLGGKNTGYATALLVRKLNMAGDELDRNDKIASETGNKPSAYVLEGHEAEFSELYDILGVYDDSAVYGGLPVRVWRTMYCSEDGTISVSPTEIYINSLNPTQTVYINTVHPWEVLNPNDLKCGVYDQYGTPNDNLIARYNNEGGKGTIQIQNRTTKEIAEVVYHVNVIELEKTEDTAPYNSLSYQIPLTDNTVDGYTITCDNPLFKVDGNQISLPLNEGAGEVGNFTIISKDDPNEQKTFKLTIGEETAESPIWEVMRVDCIQE